MNVTYTDNIESLTADQLGGFFVDWPTRPDEEAHIRILAGSCKVWLAMDGLQCVGRINAISDGVFYAYIPLLEVLPAYQGKGIGRELVERMLKSLSNMYAIDLQCDESLESYYHQLGFLSNSGMSIRNYENQGADGQITNSSI